MSRPTASDPMQPAPAHMERRHPTLTDQANRHAQQARTGERVGAVLTLAAALLLEALPLAAWLTVLGLGTAPPTSPILPFWWLCTVLLAAWSVAALQRLLPASDWRTATPIWLRLLLVACFVLTLIASLLLSPDAYAGVAPNALPASLIGDVQTGSARLGVDVLIGLLVAYLWWRGLLLGRLRLTRDRLFVRFIAGLCAVVALIAVTGAATGPARQTMTALLAVLLPFDVFLGLVGIALAHVIDTAREHRQRRRGASGSSQGAEADAGDVINRAWVTTALGISAAVVIGGLALALLVSYDSLHALADLLRPVADALGTALLWLVEALAFVLFFLLDGPITWIKQHVSHQQPPPPAPVQPPVGRGPTQANIPHGFEVAAGIVVIALIAALVILVLLWVLRRFGEWRRAEDFEEERETLRPGEVVGAQLRDLLASLLPHPKRPAPEEALIPGSVRALYRQMLRVAARGGIARAPAETPDEYAQRLAARAAATEVTPLASAQVPGAADGATGNAFERSLADLSSAYDDARYGAPAAGDTPASPDVQAAAQTIERWLVENANGHHDGRATAQRRIRRRDQGRAG